MSVTNLIQLIFEVYIFVLILRLLLQWFGVSYHNQVSQFVVKLTSPAVLPLRQFLPRSQNVDIALILVILLVQLAKYTVLLFMQAGVFANFAGLLLLSTADSINTLINVFLFSVLAIIVISWLNPQLRSPVTEVLHSLTDPLLSKVRSIMPDFGGIDLAPIPVMIILKLSAFYFVQPIMAVGVNISLRGLGG